MIHTFDRPDGSRMIQYTEENVWIRVRGCHPKDISNAESIVLDALDRKLPFAFNTVKKQYSLQYVRTFAVSKWIESGVVTPEGMGIEWDTDQIHEYQRIVIYDIKTRMAMKNNYDKLISSLMLLAREGYVKTFTCRSDCPRLRVVWYVDSPDERLDIQEIDYILPPDFGTHPHKPKWRQKFKDKMAQRTFDGALLAMREAFPLSPHGNGKLPGGDDRASGYYGGYSEPQNRVEDRVQAGDLDADKWAEHLRNQENIRELRISRYTAGVTSSHTKVSFVNPEAAMDEFLANILSIMWFTMRGKNLDIII